MTEGQQIVDTRAPRMYGWKVNHAHFQGGKEYRVLQNLRIGHANSLLKQREDAKNKEISTEPAVEEYLQLVSRLYFIHHDISFLCLCFKFIPFSEAPYEL
jgi:hypothetical protein